MENKADVNLLDLGELFNLHKTDKDHGGRGGLTEAYHILFAEKRETIKYVLEVGIGTMKVGAASSMIGNGLPGYKPGGSLRAWRDYFPNAEIVGIDIQEDCMLSNENRIHTFLCDSTNSTAVENFKRDLCSKGITSQFDLIIDDGSHIAMDQLNTLKNLFPLLKDNGIYALEDICSTNEILKTPSCIGPLCNFSPYIFVGLGNNLCIIHKRPLRGKQARSIF
jgi:hypothetical protein